MTTEKKGIREKIAYHWNHKDDYRSNPKLPFWVAPIALAAYFLIFYLVYISFGSLPTPLMEADEGTHPNRFIAERAQKQLKELTDIGVKVSGSIENDKYAVDYLIQEIEKINAASNSIHQIDYDIQVVSGSFYVDFKPYGMSSVYHGVKNVIVKISPAGKTTEHSLLLNTHFDTVPISTGAGDAGCMIVVMLETLRVLSLTTEPMEHSIIFLFNGSEENLLQGSHGFITQHEWAENVRAFINMDSAGNGGKEIMFQAGPEHPWLMKYYYENAPHPFASVIGEELFDANLIPSDSDFRIFRDYGNIPGIDLAYIKNGYVYHTKYDRIESIPLGTYQHTGDNLLALCRALGNADELADTKSHAEGKQVFYDVLGWFMMNYSGTTALIVNICIVVLPNVVGGIMMHSMGKQAGVVDWRVFQEYGYSFIVQFLATCVGFGLTLLPAVIFDAAGRSMSWYSQPWLVFGLYFCPMLFSLTFIPALSMMYRNKVFSLSHNIQLLMKGQNGLFILILCNLTIHSIRSAFLFLIIVFFHVCTQVFSLVTKLQNRPFAWMIVHLLGHLLPFMFFSYLTILIFTMFIPISARGGPDANPDFLISMIAAAMALLMGSLMVPLILACRKSKIIASGFGIMFLISVIIMVTPVGFPFKPETSAQRYWAFHTSREFNSYKGSEVTRDSGYFMLPMDRYSMDLVRDSVLEMDSSKIIKEDCSNELSCGVPLYTSRMIKQGPHSHWIPADPPYLNKETVLTLTGTEDIGTNVLQKRFHFNINGADHMGIYISPKNSLLTGWSFYDYIPRPGVKFNDQETYFIYFSYGLNMDTDYHFYLDFLIEDSWDLPIVDIVLNGHYTHFDSERTPKFLSFLNTFPKWSHVTSWMCSYKSYTF